MRNCGGFAGQSGKIEKDHMTQTRCKKNTNNSLPWNYWGNMSFGLISHRWEHNLKIDNKMW